MARLTTRSPVVGLLLCLSIAAATAVHAQPGEISGVRHDGAGFSWDPDTSATAYRVYRGAVGDLDQTTPADCYAPGLSGNRFFEPAAPAAGEAFYYLVTAVDGTGEGPAGSDSSGGTARGLAPCVTDDPLGVNVVATEASAFEREGQRARFEISRSGSGTLDEVTVRFTLVGDDDPTRGSAGPEDYRIESVGGAALDYAVVLPQGATSVEVVVDPVDDGSLEVPETLQLVLLQDPSYTLGDSLSDHVRIRDAANVVENERLFLAFLIPATGVQTTGGGIAIVRVQGDNDRAWVDLSFSGLTAPQTGAHVHVSNPADGPIVRGLPFGQVSSYPWEIRASQFLITDQQMLDALSAGQLYVAVKSQANSEGEIRGQLVQQEGSTELVVPPDPPPLPTLTGHELDRDIVRFLTQSTFGPTPESVEEVRQLIQSHGGDRVAGMSAWIDGQIDPVVTPMSPTLPFTRASSAIYGGNPIRDRRAAWWLNAAHGRDQLRQRVAFALSQIFVVSDEDSKLDDVHLGTAQYYDNLIYRAFGSYRDLLLTVSMHPTMGQYLSHLRNQREQVDDLGQVIVSPDENYAREIMQLFGFGLIKRHLDGTIVLDGSGAPVPTYDNVVITEMARVFTGLSFTSYDVNGEEVENNKFGRGSQVTETQYRWLLPMKMFQNYHDEGTKTIFDGHVIPGGQWGLQDILQVHDLIAAHPTTAPFISRLLIQRLVTSNPSRGYVYRVAGRFVETGGDLGEVVRSILLDYEARHLPLTEGVGYGKIKEPLLVLSAIVRLLDARSNVPLSVLDDAGYPATESAKFPADATIMRFQNLDNLGQVAQSAPTVFNFYLPDFKLPGATGEAGLFTPELQITSEAQRYAVINFHRSMITRNNGAPATGVPPGYASSDGGIRLDLAILQQIHDADLAIGDEISAAEAVVDFVDLYMNAGGLKGRYEQGPEPNPRSLMIETIANSSNSGKIKNGLIVMISSPQLSVQR